LFVVLLAVEGFFIPSYLEEWGEILFGLALVVAPWTFDYEAVSATVSSMVSGILAWISTEPNSPNLTPARLHILWAFSPCSVMLNGALIAFLRGVTWPHVFTFRGISAFLLAK
jgi:hypothetical protein